MLEAFGLSDPGCVRANNEDYFISDSDSGIFVLADGMGGANAGEYASRLSAESLYEYLLNSPSNDGVDTLEQGFRKQIGKSGKPRSSNPELDGMGTTLVVAGGRGRAGANRRALATAGLICSQKVRWN